MGKKLSPKLAQKSKRNEQILQMFRSGKLDGSMTMGVVEDIKSHFGTVGEKISVSTILRIIRNNNHA